MRGNVKRDDATLADLDKLNVPGCLAGLREHFRTSSTCNTPSTWQAWACFFGKLLGNRMMAHPPCTYSPVWQRGSNSRRGIYQERVRPWVPAACIELARNRNSSIKRYWMQLTRSIRAATAQQRALRTVEKLPLAGHTPRTGALREFHDRRLACNVFCDGCTVMHRLAPMLTSAAQASSGRP
jgi:hypothetical protein